jgi:HAD superfamily hydrolase (TIGR01509 family)
VTYLIKDIPPPSPLEGILFDLGGTLDGDGEHWLNRFFLLYQQYLPQVSWDRLKAAFYEAEAVCMSDPQVATMDLGGLVNFHVNRQLAALNKAPSDAAGYLAEKFLKSCRLKLKRNTAVLARLARRYRLGVVSNFYGNAPRLLAEVGIAPLLTAIVDSNLVGVSKPDPAIFTLALHQLALPPEVVAYVGDSYNQDIRPAKQAGLITIWLRNDAMSAPLPPDFTPDLADYQIRSLVELESLVK